MKTKIIIHSVQAAIIITCLCLCFIISSCGVMFGGKLTDCQKQKPVTGKRQIRPAALMFDILSPYWFISLPVDFTTGGIYKPCRQAVVNPKTK